MRVVLGALRFFVALFGSLASGVYILFGVLYDEEATRYLGAVGGRTESVDQPLTSRDYSVTHVLTHTH